MGDHLRVRVARVDIDRRELDFRLVSREKRAPAKQVKKKSTRRQRQATTKTKVKAASKRKTTKSAGKARATGKTTGKKTTPRKRKR